MQIKIPLFKMGSSTNGELPQTMIEVPQESQESFDGKYIPNENLEPFMISSAPNYDLDSFLRANSGPNFQWQTMDTPIQNVVESETGLWTLDIANEKLLNADSTEPATSNLAFDSFTSSMSVFQSDNWFTSFLESAEPVLNSSVEFASSIEQPLPLEYDQPKVELRPKEEAPSIYTAKIEPGSPQKRLGEEFSTSAASKTATDLPSLYDHSTSRPSVEILATPRNMEDCLIDFQSGMKAPKRKRKEFNRREKLKVHLVRQVGACQSCRARKVEVGLPDFNNFSSSKA